MEQALGRIINVLNPYSNPKCESLTESRMELVGRPRPTGASLPPQGGKIKAGDNSVLAQLTQIEVEIDNYDAEWTVRGQTYKVTRALRIPYRYELRDKNGNPNGVWVTEQLLIGFAGGNGGG